MTAPAPARQPWVDLLKVVAAQAIVLHHLASYGPLAEQWAQLAPAAADWFARHARIAVQVFLVIGGYLAARQLAPHARWRPGSSAWRAIAARYLRLVPPYGAVLVLAVSAAALARRVMADEMVPGPPTAGQWLAHLLLLQDLLGIDALSAGVWYVAIDFQLYALLVGVLMLALVLDHAARRRTAPLLVALLVAASLLHFNRDARWDVAAPYFVGAYGLGVLAAWAPLDRRRWAWLALGTVWVGLALVVEWRSRIAVAALTAASLMLWPARAAPWHSGVIAYWSRRSYALFLIHFPVLLLANAAFVHFAPAGRAAAGVGLLLAWAGSLAAAAGFYRFVEQPTARRLRTQPAPSALRAG
jgi:peptidoglycan/LPS O-acetylase OafA/YrhL